MPTDQRKKQTLVLIRKLNGNEAPMAEQDMEKQVQIKGDEDMDTPAPEASPEEEAQYSKKALAWIRDQFGGPKTKVQ